jgi:hypothetical protein
MLSYFLSTRQELDSIDARKKMEASDASLSSLEKEYVASKSKLEEDLKAANDGKEEAVKAAVKAKYDEVASLKGKVKSLEKNLLWRPKGTMRITLSGMRCLRR